MHDLKKREHELCQLRHGHLQEIEQLKNDMFAAANSVSYNEAGIVGNMSEMFPSDELATAREDAARLQVGSFAVSQNLSVIDIAKLSC